MGSFGPDRIALQETAKHCVVHELFVPLLKLRFDYESAVSLKKSGVYRERLPPPLSFSFLFLYLGTLSVTITSPSFIFMSQRTVMSWSTGPDGLYSSPGF